MKALAVCVLCGAESLDVSRGVVVYRTEDATGNRYHSIDRCRDHEACWRRCVDGGNLWPVADHRPLSRIVLA